MAMMRSEVADRSGVSRATVRYWEQRGLIPEPDRTDGGYRVYYESDVDRIRFIVRAKKLGFSLKEVRELLAIRIAPDCDSGDVRKKAIAKAECIRRKVHDLLQIEAVLMGLASACDGTGSMGNCPILDALDNGLPSRERNLDSACPDD